MPLLGQKKFKVLNTSHSKHSNQELTITFGQLIMALSELVGATAYTPAVSLKHHRYIHEI